MHLIHDVHNVAFIQTLHTDIWYIILQQNTSRGVTDLFVILPTLKQPMCVYIIALNGTQPILYNILHLNIFILCTWNIEIENDGKSKKRWFMVKQIYLICHFTELKDLFGFLFPKR